MREVIQVRLMIKGATRAGTIEKQTGEAKAVGIVWLEKIDSAFSLYQLPCGHKEKLRPAQVRVKRAPYLACRACVNSSLEQRYINDALLQNLRWIKKLNKDWSLYEFPCGHSQKVQMAGMSDKKEPYNQCDNCSTVLLEANYREEAMKHGITLLRKHENKPKYWHCSLPCGHDLVKTARNITQGAVSCEKCKVENYEITGADRGLKPISHKAGSEYWTWQFIKCGHYMDIQPANVLHGTPVCPECFTEKLTNEADSKSLELLGAAISPDLDSNFRSYRFKLCGHLKDIAIQSVRNGEFECRVCLEIEWKQVAKKLDLTFVARSSTRGRALYRFDHCGHERELQRSQVKQATTINCEECNETSWSKPSSVYLIKFFFKGEIWLKLGHTNNLRLRIIQYGLIDGVRHEPLRCIFVSSRTIAEQLEKETAELFKEYRLDAETMNQYLTRSGYTECYAAKEESNILKVLDTICAPEA